MSKHGGEVLGTGFNNMAGGEKWKSTRPDSIDSVLSFILLSALAPKSLGWEMFSLVNSARSLGSKILCLVSSGLSRVVWPEVK